MTPRKEKRKGRGEEGRGERGRESPRHRPAGRAERSFLLAAAEGEWAAAGGSRLHKQEGSCLEPLPVPGKYPSPFQRLPVAHTDSAGPSPGPAADTAPQPVAFVQEALARGGPRSSQPAEPFLRGLPSPQGSAGQSQVTRCPASLCRDARRASPTGIEPLVTPTCAAVATASPQTPPRHLTGRLGHRWAGSCAPSNQSPSIRRCPCTPQQKTLHLRPREAITLGKLS
ncbi:uncharacterized protein LOC113950195 [Corapipo altera]|uniref:uncharacterized protein LOC113950195 n=1 Tax=Corapipo altera TaxID=415028 RepID=UPI000FD674D0|nr:uncharacterized protein LOC113950195 [Corapipo altera]